MAPPSLVAGQRETADATGQPQEFWAYALMDTSRVSTLFVAILLVVYGSFRSLNMEQEAQRRDREKPAGANKPGDSMPVQTIDSTQALLLPVGASVSLLVMFFFFDSLQTVFALCTAVVATAAFAFLLLPMCQYLLKPCSDGTKISFGLLGRYTTAELLAFGLAFTLVCLWVLTGHWLLMDALGMGLSVAFIALVRLPSLKVSTVLLSGLLLYDIFWSSRCQNYLYQVFFSSYLFNANVMVHVATRPADNPVGLVAKKLQLIGVIREAPKLSLPGKLVFPSSHMAGRFTMLGLGDIVMPGLLLCFVLRYDAHKRMSLNSDATVGEGGGGGGSCCSTAPAILVPPVIANWQRVTYFHCSLIGYAVGLLTATISSEVFKMAQPALLYLVPFTLLPLLVMAYVKGDLSRMWHEPFNSFLPQHRPKYQLV